MCDGMDDGTVKCHEKRTCDAIVWRGTRKEKKVFGVLFAVACMPFDISWHYRTWYKLSPALYERLLLVVVDWYGVTSARSNAVIVTEIFSTKSSYYYYTMPFILPSLDDYSSSTPLFVRFFLWFISRLILFCREYHGWYDRANSVMPNQTTQHCSIPNHSCQSQIRLMSLN